MVRTTLFTKDHFMEIKEEIGKLQKALFETERLLREERKKYLELIYCVESKYPGESRHETAKRYLEEREMSKCTSKIAESLWNG